MHTGKSTLGTLGSAWMSPCRALMFSCSAMSSQFYVLSVTLRSADQSEDVIVTSTGLSGSRRVARMMTGATNCSSEFVEEGPDGQPGFFFFFSDLAVRTEGTY